ncbi:hypothetical protein PIB30_044929 [Stylosanthes scabra]|uniref:Uncharacterized protein n=1 Tax=Stylosanthes scabra TaxID=79078 RepID=A0ABU6ZER8_9FABA|nr:hypothetical protein [Stylosanthes scabra]
MSRDLDVGHMSVERVAYRHLNMLPPNQFKYKIFCVDGEEHVRGMFDLHGRYGPREVMELLTEIQTVQRAVGGPTRSGQGAAVAIHASRYSLGSTGGVYAD